MSFTPVYLEASLRQRTRWLLAQNVVSGPFPARRGVNFGVYPNPDDASSVQGAINDFVATAGTFKQRLISVNDALLKAAQNVGPFYGQQNALDLWQSWHDDVVSWMNDESSVASQLQSFAAQGLLTQEGWSAFQAADTQGIAQAMAEAFEGKLPAQSVVDDWTARGVNHANSGRKIAKGFRDESIQSELSDFIAAYPAAMANALNGVIHAAGSAVNVALKETNKALFTATWGISRTILLLGGALAAGFWLLQKSGAKINAGPVRLNGIVSGYNRGGRSRHRGFGGLNGAATQTLMLGAALGLGYVGWRAWQKNAKAAATLMMAQNALDAPVLGET